MTACLSEPWLRSTAWLQCTFHLAQCTGAVEKDEQVLRLICELQRQQHAMQDRALFLLQGQRMGAEHLLHQHRESVP